jgi:hypothetical protein
MEENEEEETGEKAMEEKEMEEKDLNPDVIASNYLKPSHPTAFSSVANIFRFYNGKFGKNTIANALKDIFTYNLHREYKKPKYRNPIYVYSLREHIQMDLIDMAAYAKSNDGITFIMVAIDSFSKKAWVKPMKNKSADVSLEKIKELVQEIQPPMKALFLDRGREFKNKKVQAFLREQNIKMIHPYSETKAAIAERFNRTLKDLIFKYFDAVETFRYIDVLDELVSSYNNRGHRTLRYLTPNEAEKEENKSLVICALNLYYTKATGGVKKRKPKYKVGQKVIIKILPDKFQRGFQKRFKEEHFEIVEINTKMPIPMYKLKSLNDNEIVKGGFYANELQPIKGDVFKIKVLKTKTGKDGKKKIYVRWIGYDDRHNSWINADDVTEDFRIYQK